MSAPEGYLDLDQVAAKIRRTPKTARRWCANGLFPGAFKDGPYRTSPWYVPVGAVDDYLKSLVPQPEAS